MDGTGGQKIKKWCLGSIRRKLTFFVLLMCFLLIGLFWVFALYLLEPAYTASIQKDLTKTVEVFVEALDAAEGQNLPMITVYETDAGPVEGLSQECIDFLNQAIETGGLNMTDVCVDVSGQDLRSLFVHDDVPTRCVLHSSDTRLGESQSVNSAPVLYLRQGVFANGESFHKTPVQMTMGRTAASGRLAVIISANMERVPQATRVLNELMLVVSAVVIGVAVVFVLVFSRWFTRPLTQLSSATREITDGNYDVRVPVKGCDEISQLSCDFNHMAEEVKNSYEIQRDLYANVSHDLRTPLTLIKGYAETVRDLTGNDPQKRKEQLNVIVEESNRLSALVGNVLELSRVSSGVQKPEPVRFDLTQLCDEVGERYVDICEKAGGQFDFYGPEPLDIEADPGLLERVLHNLIGNASKHLGADGYIGLRVFRKDAATARVEVIDHGPGISEQDLPHLFDKYYRSRADAGKPGTGLGLSITKAILVASGFAYGVESEEGKGAMFWFEAPLAPPL